MARNLLMSLYDWGQDPGSSISGGGFAAQLPAANMLKIQTQLVAQATGGSVSFTLNLGAARNIGIVHLQRLICDPGATIVVSWGGFAFSGNAWATDTSGTYGGLEFAALNRPRIFIPTTPQFASSVSISISGGGSPLQIGYVGACEVWESPGGFALGSKITYIDDSDIQTTPFGSTYVTFRSKRRRLNIGADWLKDERPYGGLDGATVVKELMAINGYSSPVIGVRYPEDIANLERDAVWGQLRQAEIGNPYFAVSAAAFQIDQLP